MKTVIVKTRETRRAWHVIDASDAPLGRLASAAAMLLMGKTKPCFSPHQDHGDNVIVINAERLQVTGKKLSKKTYFRHSTYPGGGRVRTLKEQMQRDPRRVIIHAVSGMVSKKTKLGRAMLRKLHVYPGASHPHAAQKPEPYPLCRNGSAVPEASRTGTF